MIAGPSGSGKSTLLRVLAGLLRPQAGTVEVDGVELTSLRAGALRRRRRHTMGFVLQDPADNLVEYLRAVEQVELAAKLRGVDPAEAPTLLEAVGLADRSDSHTAQLSGGEQQRVAFAAAAIGRPTLLLADEPTAELDGAAGAALVDAMRRLVDVGATLIVSSHDPAVIAAGDHVAAAARRRGGVRMTSHVATDVVVELRGVVKAFADAGGLRPVLRGRRPHGRSAGDRGGGGAVGVGQDDAADPPGRPRAARRRVHPPVRRRHRRRRRARGASWRCCRSRSGCSTSSRWPRTSSSRSAWPTSPTPRTPPTSWRCSGSSTSPRRFPSEVSLGEQQRAALARAAVARPRLLLADEPISHQNEAWARTMMLLLDDLSDFGTACVLATHNEIAFATAHRVLELRDGQLHPLRCDGSVRLDDRRRRWRPGRIVRSPSRLAVIANGRP